jgi:glutaminase
MTARSDDLAVTGAIATTSGVNPHSGKRVVSSANVGHVLAEMATESQYEASGDWAYTVGLSGKSGVGDGIMCVALGKFAIAAVSPQLDPYENSVRARAAITEIAKGLKLNLYLGSRHLHDAQPHFVDSSHEPVSEHAPT